MYFNGYQNPKLAAIRLLRSQGCCNKKPEIKRQSKQQINTQQYSELQNLLRYKQQLESRVAHQRAKMADIPCAIQLAKQIQQLQQLIQGLGRQNKQRVRHMQATKQVNTTQSTQIQDDEQQLKQNQRLQAEYNLLMRRLEKVNDRNTMLVNKLINF